MDDVKEDFKQTAFQVPGSSSRKAEVKDESKEDEGFCFEALKALESAVVDDDLAAQQESTGESENGLDQLFVGNMDHIPVEEVESPSGGYFPFGELNFSETSGSTYNPPGMKMIM